MPERSRNWRKIVVILAVWTIVLSCALAWTLNFSNSKFNCLFDYTQDSSQILKERTAVNKKLQARLHRLTAAIEKGTTQEQFSRLVVEYNDVYEDFQNAPEQDKTPVAQCGKGFFS